MGRFLLLFVSLSVLNFAYGFTYMQPDGDLDAIYCRSNKYNIGGMALYEKKLIDEKCEMAECLPDKRIAMHLCPRIDLRQSACKIRPGSPRDYYPDCCDSVDCPPDIEEKVIDKKK